MKTLLTALSHTQYLDAAKEASAYSSLVALNLENHQPDSQTLSLTACEGTFGTFGTYGTICGTCIGTAGTAGSYCCYGPDNTQTS